jgi:hypothetical protein
VLFPAGLNDCISGHRWANTITAAHGIGRIILAGEATATAIRGLQRDADLQ